VYTSLHLTAVTSAPEDLQLQISSEFAEYDFIFRAPTLLRTFDSSAVAGSKYIVGSGNALYNAQYLGRQGQPSQKTE
jgi:hypothetical protein